MLSFMSLGDLAPFKWQFDTVAAEIEAVTKVSSYYLGVVDEVIETVKGGFISEGFSIWFSILKKHM